MGMAHNPFAIDLSVTSGVTKHCLSSLWGFFVVLKHLRVIGFILDGTLICFA